MTQLPQISQITGTNRADNLVGTDAQDLILGLGGNDTISGGKGNDIVTGGSGADVLLFNTGAAFSRAAIGVDRFQDFNQTQADKISLSKTTFAALQSVVGNGLSVATEFAVVATDQEASKSAAFIVYNSANGKVFYNPNGSIGGFASSSDAGGQFAVLATLPTLTAADFTVVA